MVDINRNYTTGQIKTVIDGGMEVLRYIEGIAYDKVAEDFIQEVRDINQKRNGTFGGMGVSDFTPQFARTSFGQNSYSGWDLPETGTEKWRGKMLAPIGFGSPAGFLTIAAKYEQAGSAEVFERQTGFSGEMARKVFEFTRLLQEFVNYARTFYHLSPAVAEQAAAPWYHHATSFHTVWDTIIVQHHRLPFHVLARQTSVAGARPAQATAQARIQAIFGKSGQAVRFLEQALVGRADTRANLIASSRRASEQLQDQTFIAASLSGEATNSQVFYDPIQRSDKPATSAEELFPRLPAFARSRYPANLFNQSGELQSGGFLRPVVLGEGANVQGLSKASESILKAHDLIMALIHNTAQESAPANPEQVKKTAERETARALLLNVLSYVLLDDVKDSSAAGDSEKQALIANRINAIAAQVIEPYVQVKQLTNPNLPIAVRESLVDSLRPLDFINTFKRHATSTLGAKVAGPYRFTNESEIEKGFGYLKTIINAQDTVLESIEKAPAVAQVRHNPADYMASPLLFSPEQLVSHYKLVSEGTIPIALPADTQQPGEPMSAATEGVHARAILMAKETPSEANISALDSFLVPMQMEVDAQVRNISILTHIDRARRYRADISRTRKSAFTAEEGSPVQKVRINAGELDGDAASTMDVISPETIRGPTGASRKRSFAPDTTPRPTGNSTFTRKSDRDAAAAAEQASLEYKEETSGIERSSKRLRSFGHVDAALPEM